VQPKDWSDHEPFRKEAVGNVEKLIERRIAFRLRHAFDLSRHQPADVERLAL